MTGPRRQRVVLDSNIYLSALLFGGKPGAVLEAAERGQFELLASSFIRAEVEGILARKFGFSRAMIRKACAAAWEAATFIETELRVDLCRDPDDNRVLECAIAGEAEFVVTGDRDLLELPPVTAYRIVTAAAFLDALGTLR